jgi:hypothetical protein
LNEETNTLCEHLVAEGDPEAQMVYHWPLLNELFELAEKAYELEIPFVSLGKGIRGWEEPMEGDERDVLMGDFLREVAGFRTKSLETQSVGPMGGIYFWIFMSPRSARRIEREFVMLRHRLQQTIASAQGS